jgi:hypothetical protein
MDSSRNMGGPSPIIPSSSRVHNSLASLLAKSILEVRAIVLGQEITSDGLTTVLVDSLEDLVTGGVSQTREERNELSSDRSGCMVPENDLVQLARTRYTRLVAHQSLRNGVDRVEDSQLSDTSGTRTKHTSQARLLLATTRRGHVDDIEGGRED